MQLGHLGCFQQAFHTLHAAVLCCGVLVLQAVGDLQNGVLLAALWGSPRQ
jgi:hypothetical protein